MTGRTVKGGGFSLAQASTGIQDFEFKGISNESKNLNNLNVVHKNSKDILTLQQAGTIPNTITNPQNNDLLQYQTSI